MVFYTFHEKVASYKACSIVSYSKFRIPDIPSIEQTLEGQGYQDITLEGMCKL